jgi:uncharacterized paraquat-inducible protein A
LKPAPLANDGVRLYARCGWKSCYIPLLLVVSLFFNILALTTNFLEISMWFKATLNYDLPHMVLMMWQEDLYIISVLILFFSIIFPLFKIMIMFVVWFGPRTFKRQKRLHELVRNLGKWSFMDIFVVALLLALTNKQAAISAVPQPGVYYFIVAILISMLTSELLHRILHCTALKLGEAYEPKVMERTTCPLFTLGFFGWCIGVLLITSIIALCAAVGFPFLEINQFLMSSYSYDIYEVIKAVYDLHQPIVGTMLFAFLIVMPSVRVLGTTLLWFAACRLHRRLACVRILNIFARWSMLDVFGLALILILTEGQDMVKTDVGAGAYLLVLAIVTTVVLPVFATWLDPVRRLPVDAQET